MRIDNSQQMFQQIDAGANLKVGKDNTLQTQSGIEKFFQSVGDAFRKLSTSGQATIQTRNERLQTTMATLLRNEAMPNLAAMRQGAHPAPLNELKNLVMARMEIAKGLDQFPKDMRPEIGKFAAKFMQLPGVLAGTPAEVRKAAQNCIQGLASRPLVCQLNGLMKQEMNANQLAKMKDLLIGETVKTFEQQHQRRVGENGIFDAFLADYDRHSIHTVNGQPAPPGKEAGAAMIQNLVPNEKIRAFVTMAASQGGLEGSVWAMNVDSRLERPTGIPPLINDLMQQGVMGEIVHHQYDLSTENGNLYIHMRCDMAYTASRNDDMVNRASGDGVDMGTHSYEMTLAIPLEQDMIGKVIPDFTVTQFSLTPS